MHIEKKTCICTHRGFPFSCEMRVGWKSIKTITHPTNTRVAHLYIRMHAIHMKSSINFNHDNLKGKMWKIFFSLPSKINII